MIPRGVFFCTASLSRDSRDVRKAAKPAPARQRVGLSLPAADSLSAGIAEAGRARGDGTARAECSLGLGVGLGLGAIACAIIADLILSLFGYRPHSHRPHVSAHSKHKRAHKLGACLVPTLFGTGRV